METDPTQVRMQELQDFMEHLNRSQGTSFPTGDAGGSYPGGHYGGRDGNAGRGYGGRGFIPRGGGRYGRGREVANAGGGRNTGAGSEDST